MNRCLTGLRRSVRAQVSCTFSVAQSLFLMGSSVRCAEFFLFFVAQSHPLSCRASKIIFFSFSDGCSATVTSRAAFFYFFDPSIPWRAQYSFFFLFACCRSAGQPVRAKLFFFWLCMQKLCYFSPVLSLSCGACSSLFFFACCRSAGQQDSLCAPDFFIFYFFFCLFTRAQSIFFQSLLVCVPLFLSGQQGCGGYCAAGAPNDGDKRPSSGK